MSHGKQFTLYSHAKGPNGWKVAIVLEELGLTYETTFLDFQKGEHKAADHTQHNPNGRIPTIIDHKNNNYTLWESDAILLYLVERYDPEHKLSVTSQEDKFHQLQWLFFQSSGQGPYFGQAAWFTFYHSEQLPSAQQRYKNEIKRVLGVLNTELEKREYLVGGKLTIADLSFIPWNNFVLGGGLYEGKLEQDLPAVAKWHAKLIERATVKKIWAQREAL
ncbi:uncharacterized protein PHACADRAFT_260333 [Phanerochaete carnosa HHB-10118-sp]|uniref:glutathione transferase n=1 Tax=Phanerochaete carnosa (strain HHB-10118-sp) TaxID=650164 RepID=K5UV06_PHACS|nr:uncharacterized protein PHACADRAFT_260333 [Phanerochaete carnosa HHB-10118-sp]EKM53801.1 hypothetical protein PHACADRAFT_260333 [Phanerochaete carnosa HHB-10118-sp]